MEERLQILMANEYPTSELSGNSSTLSDSATWTGGISAVGWRLLDDRSSWAPCPIGVYYFES